MDSSKRQTGLGGLGHSAGRRVVVTSRGPFAVGSVVWRDARGALACTVVAKASYELAPGECALLKEPIDLQEDDAYWEGDTSKSVRVPSDLAPFKNAAEVVVVGSAFAPAERPVHSVTARVLIESVDKAVEAWTPRRRKRNGAFEGTAPQARFSLRFERAAGGPQTDNPVGLVTDAFDGLGRTIVPELLPPFHKLDAPGDFIPTVGLGPIAPSWRSRALYLSEQDRTWLRTPAEAPLPPSFPVKFFQVAPPDQWLSRPLAANERLILEGLHADIPRLVTNLPGIEPRAFVVGKIQEPLRLMGDLLFIDTDRGIATLTFRAQMALDEEAGPVRLLVIEAPMGGEVAMDSLRGADGDAEDEMQRTASALHQPASLPAPRPPPAAAPPPSAPSRQPAQSDLEAPASDVLEADDPFSASTGVGPAPGPTRSALPFTAPASAPRPARASYPDAVLPFRGASPQEASPRSLIAAPSSAQPALRVSSVPSAPAAVPPPQPVVAPALVPSPVPQVRPVVVPPAPVGFAAVAPPAPLSASPPSAAPPVAPTPTWSPWQAGAASAPSAPGALSSPGARSSPSVPAAAGSLSAPAAEPTLQSRAVVAPKPSGSAGTSKSFDAAFGGAKAASDAAADKERTKDSARREGADSAAPQPLRRHAVVDLLYFDPKIIPRLRTIRRFAELWSAAPKARVVQATDAPRVEEPPRDRTDVLRVLSCGRVAEPAEIRRALADSLDDLMDFDVPLVLVAGELRPTFDEVEMLRATVTVVQPVAGPDKKVSAALALAQEALAASSPPRADIAVSLCRQIEQAAASLSLPPRYVASHVERLLVEERKLKRRPILGAPRVRAELSVPGGGDPMLIYIPDATSASLPLLPSWPAIALCEIRSREDVVETHPEALLAVAFGRVLHGRSEG